MQMRSFGARLALVATMVLPLVSCQQFYELRATKVFMDANTQYERADYVAAAEMYEEVITNDPNHMDAYFYLANSYDNLFRPALRGEPDNDLLLEKAIDHYISSVDIQTDQAMRTLSMQYLVAAFGPDKANDPTKQEPVVQRLIASDPANPDNYFRLAKLYEDSGLYAEAEQLYLQVADLRADDPTGYLQMAGFTTATKISRRRSRHSASGRRSSRTTRRRSTPSVLFTGRRRSATSASPTRKRKST